MRVPLRDMSSDEVKHTVDEALTLNPDLKWVAIGGFGEPLLAPTTTINLVKYLTDKRIKHKLATNSQLLEENRSKQLLEAGLFWTILSIDAHDEETYRKIRPQLDWNTVTQNAYNHIEQAKKYGSTTQIAIVLCQENASKIMEIHQFWRKKGIAFNISPEIPEYPACLKERIIHPLSYLPYYTVNINPFCSHEIVIKSNGDIVPCCQDWHHLHVFGNLFEEPLKDIWMNDKMKNFRKQVLTKEAPEICKAPPCPTHYLFWGRHLYHLEETIVGEDLNQYRPLAVRP